ncbi:oligosaccharide flippase family protein [Actibacterium ureilyticum]|uniref:oligosaccharide flippase family protein n=1 Tax=Actibacterium ureilyticum TaxID=1590614 RepID=UPI000BAAECCA|nr:oligosaccharide flippase family protein [Actibacterium ureilyticum]
MFKSVLLLLSGNAFSALMLLIRNLLVARLISVSDYGIAATFAISMAMVEMMSNLGLQQMIVQDKDGEDPALQAGLQGFQALRGVLSSLILLLLAHPLAMFLGVPHVAWAYQAMALVPLMNGFMHFDVFRMQRQMRYLPHMLTVSVPALVSVLLVWPLDRLFGDYRVMLFAVLAQSMMTLVTSHLTAKSRYRIRMDRQIMGRGLRFGWPLLINGMLLFIVFHGEKLVVGRELGMAKLAILAMGFTLTLTPTLVVSRSVQSFFLPQLSRPDLPPEKFTMIGIAAVEANLLNGLVQVAGIMLFGPLLVQWVLNTNYGELVPLLLFLSILHAVRVFKAGPAAVALACAQTDNAMWANLCRVLTVPLAWYAAAQGYGLTTVVWIALGGELCGFAVALILLRRRVGFDLRPLRGPVIACFLFLTLLFLYGLISQGILPLPINLNLLAGLCIATFGLALFMLGGLRRYVLDRKARRP